MTFRVEVSNNARREIVVKAIRVESLPTVQPTYQVDNTYRAFDQRIAENEDNEFELPMTGRIVRRDSLRQMTTSDSPRILELAVTVVLEGSDTYRCRFFVPAPVS